MGGSGHTHWLVPALSLLLNAGVQRSWSMWDLGGSPAWEGGCCRGAHTCAHGAHTALHLSAQLYPPRPRSWHQPCCKLPSGLLWLRVVWAESIAVSSRYTGWNPLVLTPVCAGSSHQLEDELKFKTLKGSGTLLQTRHFPCLFPALQALTGSAGAQRVMARLWQPWWPGTGLCLGLFCHGICLPVPSAPSAVLGGPPELGLLFSKLAVAKGSAWAGGGPVGPCSTGGLGALRGSQCGGLWVPPLQHILSSALPQPQVPAQES